MVCCEPETKAANSDTNRIEQSRGNQTGRDQTGPQLSYEKSACIDQDPCRVTETFQAGTPHPGVLKSQAETIHSLERGHGPKPTESEMPARNSWGILETFK